MPGEVGVGSSWVAAGRAEQGGEMGVEGPVCLPTMLVEAVVLG